ncbi:unnamed protein product [Spirodela intermedia]|uniref:Uncharacterized protein n=1 Tax=Spirodela intermedia TaxID=51605 RepID=A0A7I8I8P0_SPIIN|nr:unnamed protein product [Spirodela intermedia]CAA6653980.1 unnamed protein product [Spirodela intermedia]
MGDSKIGMCHLMRRTAHLFPCLLT